MISRLSPEVPQSTFTTKQQEALWNWFQPWDEDLLAIANSGLAAPWTYYDAAFWPAGGAFGGGAYAHARYMRMGTVVHMVYYDCYLPNVGSANGYPFYLSLPFPTPTGGVFAGRENAVNGGMLQGILTTTYMTVLYYNNTGTCQNGARYYLSGTYECSP